MHIRKVSDRIWARSRKRGKRLYLIIRYYSLTSIFLRRAHKRFNSAIIPESYEADLRELVADEDEYAGDEEERA